MSTLVLLTCDFCNQTFNRPLNTANLRKKTQCKNAFCSTTCQGKHRTENKTRIVNCTNCDKVFRKTTSQINKSKSGNHFCCKPCFAIHYNKNKKHGTRRSKLEVWLEQELTKLHPNHNILFNDKSTIKSELDIYFPDLKLAIEINGIFHYKPIYGEDKLKQIQKNDKRKALLCEENDITFHSIDTSKLKHFTEQRAKNYLVMVQQILVVHEGNAPSP